jgi:uncharacterized membrane protein YkvA (DUF1232 family)
MEGWQVALLVALALVLVLAVAAFLLWRTASARTKSLGGRIGRLPWRLRLKLAWILARDERIPLAIRAVPPLLVVYLAMPLDIVPDFIPVLGQIDDVVVVLVAFSLVARFVPLDVLEAHLSLLEAERLTSEPHC